MRPPVMMMIGQLNASHTGVRGGPSNPQAEPLQTRYPGFDIEADDSGFYRVGQALVCAKQWHGRKWAEIDI